MCTMPIPATASAAEGTPHRPRAKAETWRRCAPAVTTNANQVDEATWHTMFGIRRMTGGARIRTRVRPRIATKAHQAATAVVMIRTDMVGPSTVTTYTHPEAVAAMNRMLVATLDDGVKSAEVDEPLVLRPPTGGVVCHQWSVTATSATMLQAVTAMFLPTAVWAVRPTTNTPHLPAVEVGVDGALIGHRPVAMTNIPAVVAEREIGAAMGRITHAPRVPMIVMVAAVAGLMTDGKAMGRLHDGVMAAGGE